MGYVTNAFLDNPKGLKTDWIAELRDTKSKTGAEYTEQELLEFSMQGAKRPSAMPLYR